MKPTAKSFVLDLLSTIRRGTMPVAALVEAAVLFEIPQNNLRVALARLLAGGVLARDERGRYRLGPRASSVGRRLGGWRNPERSVRPWNGGWIGVHLDREAGVRDRRGRERALRLLGFRPLARALAVRPDNLRLEPSALREELHGLGLPPSDLVFAIRGLDPAAGRRARRLWPVDAIRAGHRRRLAELERSARRMPGMAAEKAMVESFLLGGEIIRQLVLDPLLPDEICPSSERDALAAAMRRYDGLGRSAWAEFLARYDVPHHRNPIHTRMLGDAAAVA